MFLVRCSPVFVPQSTSEFVDPPEPVTEKESVRQRLVSDTCNYFQKNSTVSPTDKSRNI